MKLLTYLLLTICFSNICLAQSPEAIQKEAMTAFDWLIGDWEGTAITQMGPTNRDTVLMVEKIKKGLDGTIILVEGLGYQMLKNNEKGEIGHDAFAVISYDDKTKKYRWHSWRVPYGLYTKNEPTVTEKGFTWSVESPRGKFKYTINQTENREWHEIGEFSKDGNKWNQFFEMKLTRKK